MTLFLALPIILAAGDYPAGPMSDWYRSLRQPGTGVSCCDVSDCKPVEARTGAEGWEAFIGARWVRVPPEKVLQARDNPTGSAVACYTATDRDIYWLCFVAPSMA